MSTTQPPASPARCRACVARPSMAGRAMTRPSATDVQCEALFASGVPASDILGPDAVAEAIMRTLRRLGRQGCAGLMAQEFGDHPEVAGERMRWARRVVTGTLAPLPC